MGGGQRVAVGGQEQDKIAVDNVQPAECGSYDT